MITRRTAGLAIAGAGLASKSGFAQNVRSLKPRTIDDFFREFTDQWVRLNPNLATTLRYFSGEEQDRLERQLTSLNPAWAIARIQLARKGQAELHKFDPNRVTPAQRLAGQVMAWQLEIAASEQPYLDYTFPLEQMNGWNVAAVERFTVGRPL